VYKYKGTTDLPYAYGREYFDSVGCMVTQFGMDRPPDERHPEEALASDKPPAVVDPYAVEVEQSLCMCLVLDTPEPLTLNYLCAMHVCVMAQGGACSAKGGA
jgi:hypothetical protein